MYNFTQYNIEDLTGAQREQINEINKRYDERLEKLRSAEFYGIYHGAVRTSDLETARKLEIEMVVGGHIVATEVKYMLHDKDGNAFEGELMFHEGGHYGMHWVLEKRYVPVPKHIEDLRKQGYEVYKHEMKYMCDFDGTINDLGSPLFTNITLVEDVPTKVDDISEVCVHANWVDFSYNNQDYIKEQFNYSSPV